MESFPFRSFLKKARARRGVARRGFTLIEMMVVLAIIVIIVGVTVLGQSTFNQTLLLTDTTYTVALSIRQSQTLGLSSLYTPSNAGYGVEFLMAKPTSYIVFADTTSTALNVCPVVGVPGTPEAHPGNCVYDSTDQTVQTYNFSQGFLMSRICGTQAGSRVTWCNDTPGSQLNGVDMVFTRPNTDTILTGIPTIGTNRIILTDATIYIASPDGAAERCVRVSSTGEVSVLESCP